MQKGLAHSFGEKALFSILILSFSSSEVSIWYQSKLYLLFRKHVALFVYGYFKFFSACIYYYKWCFSVYESFRVCVNVILILELAKIYNQITIDIIKTANLCSTVSGSISSRKNNLSENTCTLPPSKYLVSKTFANCIVSVSNILHVELI